MDNSLSFKSFDLFQVSIPVSYQKNYLYKTNLGATLTIISFIIISACFLYEISTILDKTSFTIVSSESQDSTAKIDFSFTPIMFQLLDLTWNPVEYDPRIFTVSGTYTEAMNQIIDGKSKRITKVRNIEFERCDKLKKEYKSLSEFIHYNLTNYMCIKPNQSLILYGTATDIYSGLKTFEIHVSKCNNITNHDCYNSDFIDDLIENRIFSVTYLGYSTNFTNIEHGKNVKYEIYTNFISLSKYLRKTIINSFSNCKLNLFDNFFVSYKTEVNFFSIKSSFEDFEFVNDTSNRGHLDGLVYFHFMYDGFIIDHTKNVKGVGSTLSYIAITFNTIVIIARFINDYYGRKILFSDIFKFMQKRNIKLQNIKNFKNKEMDASNNDLIFKSSNFANNIENENINNFNKKNILENSKIKSKKALLNSVIIKKNVSYFKYHHKDYLKFFIYPYFLIQKNKNLYSIKDEVCSIFSIENILEIIKAFDSINAIKTEFYEIVNENKLSIQNYYKIRYNDEDLNSQNMLRILINK